VTAGSGGGRIVCDPARLEAKQAFLSWDTLAVVAFQHCQPVCAHLIDAERFPAIEADLDASKSPLSKGGAACVGEILHCNIILEPVKAATLGVRTVLLEALA
jgi:hypothetical protein